MTKLDEIEELERRFDEIECRILADVNKLVAERDALRAALVEVADYLDDRADVIDGADGRPVANDAMRMLQTVNAALGRE
jgi:hypothetical protein